MRKFIERVTVTGADDSIKPYDLIALSKRYPFVEWGILLSKNSAGLNRFPSCNWIHALMIMKSEGHIKKLSGHVCGTWVRQIAEGDWSGLKKEIPFFIDLFDRFQLNFHGYYHKVQHEKFVLPLAVMKQQIILQLDGVNNDLLFDCETASLDVVGLFDVSGGIGKLPEKWEESKKYIGYAGGLSPDNVVENIEKIEKVCGYSIWIDCETMVRSNNDSQFDLILVDKFLKNCEPYIIKK